MYDRLSRTFAELRVILVSVLPCALASSRMRCASVWTATFVGGLGAAALA